MPLLSQSEPSPPDEFYDIVVPGPEPDLWFIAVVTLAGLVVLGILAWLVAHLLRQRTTSGPPLPPGRKVMRDLDELERRHGELDPNHFSLAVSESLKDYLASRFQDRVRYETTPEFLGRIARETTKLPPAAQQELREFLVEAEELKFGHTSEASRRTRPLLARARNLVGLCESVSARS
ncbi:MAG TPA: DUF4381 family protein [Bacteroidia bacterium]|nr:DUF4381 family protein [Bacteroidia bacterium]